MLQYLVDIALKLLGSRITGLLALHDSAASVTGSGLMTALSSASCGARSRMGMRRCSYVVAAWVAGAQWVPVGLCRRVWVAGQAPRHLRSGGAQGVVDVYTCGRVSMGSDVSRAACKEMNAPRLTANAT